MIEFEAIDNRCLHQAKKSGRATGVKHLFISLSPTFFPAEEKEPQAGLAGLDWSLRLLKADGATRLEEKIRESNRGEASFHLSLPFSLSFSREAEPQASLAWP